MPEHPAARPGPVAPVHERSATAIAAVLARVREQLPPLGEDEAQDALTAVDLDQQIEVLSAAHDTLRQALSTIER